MASFSICPRLTTIAALVLLLTACVGKPHPAHALFHEYTPAEIHEAVRDRDPARLSRLLRDGANPDARDPQDERTPLITALYFEHKDQFLMLLRAGAQPGLADSMGNTPLHVAGQLNEPWRALDLLEAGAAPEAHNLQGQTFQRYLFMNSDGLLNATTRAGRQAVLAWLTRNGIAVERPAEETQSSGAKTREPVQLHYTVIGSRIGDRVYWRMDSSGKGEVAVPISGGFPIPAVAGFSEESFRFIEGTHSFDIGPAGYAEIREQLAGIISGSLCPSILYDSDPPCSRTMDFGAADLAWSGPTSGRFIHELACSIRFTPFRGSVADNRRTHEQPRPTGRDRREHNYRRLSY